MNCHAFFIVLCAASCHQSLAAEHQIVNLWPGKAPGETKKLPPEVDKTKSTDRLIAGRRIIKLGNVSTPTLAIFRPLKENDTGASVVICPGGGHHILAYDLEGTEVAHWLNTIGVTGIVLKYRVPFRSRAKRWIAAVQDAQRAVSLVRSNADKWKIDPKRIGILGFSAGGETAGLTAIFTERQYKSIDDIDKVSSRPDFAVLIYPGGMSNKDHTALRDYVKVTKHTPPMFLAHAYDDRVRIENSLFLFAALKQNKVPAELHVYSVGGHGYGLRKTDKPVTTWPRRCEGWLRASGWLKKS